MEGGDRVIHASYSLWAARHLSDTKHRVGRLKVIAVYRRGQLDRWHIFRES